MTVRPVDGNAIKHRVRNITEAWKEVGQDSDALLVQSVVEKIINTQPILTQPPITGDTSDGYHTFNELYHHRAILFSVICNFMSDKAWKAKKHHDGTMYDGMFIVGIDTPEGQATYHYDIDPYWDLFHVKELENAPKWDGHTPDEAIRRIGNLTPPNEWVSVEERLPASGQNVIATNGSDVGEAWYASLSRSWYRYNGLEWNRICREVTRWMPLPEPPVSRPPEGEEDTK